MTETSRTSNMGRSEMDMKSKIKEIPFVHDQGFFTFKTGDTYEGFFEAKKKDRSVKMHGHGVYKTDEGDTYEGSWDNDKLGYAGPVKINYIDGSKYEGLFKEWCYSGKGKYLYPDNSLLECDFVENVPTGGLKLTDPNGHIWLGKAEQGYGWLNPVNHYYDMLEKTREYGKGKRRSKVVPAINTTPTSMGILQPTLSKKSKVVVLPREDS